MGARLHYAVNEPGAELAAVPLPEVTGSAQVNTFLGETLFFSRSLVQDTAAA